MEKNKSSSLSQQGRSARLLSLDLLRGLTVAGMILVNNGYGETFEMLKHSKWNGMTPCDLVFPFFLFIMGISCYLSLSKTAFKPTKAILFKVVKRTLLLFLIGLFINWFHYAVKGDFFCFDHLRIWAVMQRIALCYFFVSLFALWCNHDYTLPVVVVLLSAYTLLLIYGNGYAEDSSANVIAQVDLRLFGYEHLYHKSPVDPEGLVGTASSIAHVLLGFWCGRLIKQRHTVEEKTVGLFVVGAVCIIAGYLLTFGLPLNKRIWSPSYVLVTCGLAAMIQALLMYVVDLRHTKAMFLVGTASPFRVFGVNALALYVASELLSVIFSRTGFNSTIYDSLHPLIRVPQWASLAYALTFVAVNYVIGYLLYRRHIYIKL